ncbi:alpha/beta fold hydrolase [Jannaschia sp. R86511]|uniref:alpha/beta fold hydrolase n=1 Tax=Jannaschia sp. R86511 TaxID=3093853 RepID=UPI0036D2138E
MTALVERRDGTDTPGSPPARRRPPWRDGLLRLGLAAAAPLVWGNAAGLWTPRGPMTATQALAAMLISLAVGVAVGVLLRSRWALLLGPVCFAAMFELTRLSTTGPLVDGIHLSEYGLFALVTGRGFHGLLTLAPILLGAVGGAALARRSQRRTHRTEPDAPARGPWGRVGAVLRGGVAVLTGLALVALAAAVAVPARTDPVLAADGGPLAGSVAELVEVEVGGHDLSMMVRGNSTDNPVLLLLAGGPGGTELGAMRHHGQRLEEDFVVVTWDQRGTGKSADQLDPTGTMTLQAAVDDTVEVSEHLRERFGQDRIYLLGQSWGSILGVLAVQQRPDLFAAFIGSGQMVSPRVTDQITYADTLVWAEDTGDTDLVDRMLTAGPPPYEVMLDYETTLSSEPDVYPYDHSANAEGPGQMSEGIFVGEYSLIEKVHNLGGFLDTASVLYPQIQDIDFRVDAASLDVPVYLFQGRHEAASRAGLAQEWFALLEAPRKQLVVAETSGHRPLWEQPEEFADFMVGTVLAETSGPAAAP